MSKIYNEYLNLKLKDPNKMYLFKNGKFYIFIADDADLINEFVVLKKIKLTKNIMKCGFPECSYEQYMKVFKNHKLNIEVINVANIHENTKEDLEKSVIKYNNIKELLNNVDLNKLTPLDSINILGKVYKLINE